MMSDACCKYRKVVRADTLFFGCPGKTASSWNDLREGGGRDHIHSSGKKSEFPGLSQALQGAGLQQASTGKVEGNPKRCRSSVHRNLHPQKYDSGGGHENTSVVVTP